MDRYDSVMMKKVNLPTKKMDQFAGKWVAIDPVKDVIVAVGDTLKEIDPFITRPVHDHRPVGTAPAAFKVPFKDEGPYILII